MKAELGRYRMRGFSIFKPIPHWDELMFLPGTLTRFVIEGYREKCDTRTVLGARFAKYPLELEIPIYIGGKVKALGIDCIPGEWTDADTELVERKFRIYGLDKPDSFQKFVCGKQLYNYDNLEPSEKKLVI